MKNSASPRSGAIDSQIASSKVVTQGLRNNFLITRISDTPFAEVFCHLCELNTQRNDKITKHPLLMQNRCPFYWPRIEFLV